MPDGDCLIDKDENFVGLSQGLGITIMHNLISNRRGHNSFMLEGHGLM